MTDAHGETHWTYDLRGRLSGLQSGQSASLLNLEFTYDSVGNILTITDQLNSSQVQTFGYDALNRLTSASTNGVGEGQYSQSYSYDPATGNLASKSDVGAYTYSSAKPHAVTKAGTNEFTYDANGSMKTRKIGDVTWTYTYGAQNQLIEIKKGAQVVSSYGYDGDGNRVWSKDFEGYQAGYPKTTYYVGNYYEYQVTGKPSGSGSSSGTSCSQPNCLYMPLVMMSDIIRTSYYYADGQRIAMKKNGVVSYIYGDQLGSVSAVADGNGNLISETLYHPWGTTRYAQGTSPTDYGYTGQMKEGDIYFYNARWYDPQLGRFMQADTLVPPTQGTQGFDRYAYVNNNPMRYTDPSGHWISNTNLLMHDGGGGWDVPRFPGGDPYYAQGIREFGLFLVLPTSFTTRELQTIYNAQVQFASGLERLGVSDGRAWMLKNLTSFAGKN
ncbi:MAG: RHS repeat-associated core domain-containing protein, partial [Anaerolineaceae bacterium]